MWASLVVRVWASRVSGLRLSSCGPWVKLPWVMWDLSSPTRDQIHVLSIGRQILNHWTTREVPVSFIFTHFKTLESFSEMIAPVFWV